MVEVLEAFLAERAFLPLCEMGNCFFRSVIASWKWRLKGSGMACFSRVLALPALVCV